MPVSALAHVGSGELPVFLGVVDPFKEALLLLLRRNMEKKFADEHAVVAQIALEATDVPKAVLPDVFRDQLGGEFLLLEQCLMHADHQDLLIVGTVEDTDAAALGQVRGATPEIIVVELLSRRPLERHHLAALRIDAGHHMLDGAILASGVHGLEEEEHGPAVLRVEHVLQLGEGLHPGLQALLGMWLVLRLQPCGITGVDVLETKFVALGDAIGLREIASPLDDLVEFHRV